MGLYLREKFQVSSIILTSFRQGVILPPSPPQKRTPKEPTQIRVSSKLRTYFGDVIKLVGKIRGDLFEDKDTTITMYRKNKLMKN